MTLLAAPLFLGSVLDKAWDKCCEELVTVSHSVNSQDALILLTSCFSVPKPKVLHLLRCSPSVLQSLMMYSDVCLIQHITNPDLTDNQWTHQASRPVKYGGETCVTADNYCLCHFCCEHTVPPSQTGQHSSVMFQISCPPNNGSVISQV